MKRLRFAHACCGGVGLALVALVQSTSVACSTTQCDPTCLAFYGASIPSSPPGGALSCDPATPPRRDDASPPQRDDAYLDGNTVVWESAPFDGQWLPYDGGAWLLVSWKKTVEDVLQGTQYEGWAIVPSQIDPYVATAQNPASGGTLVPTGDQLTEMQNVGPDGLWINNGSCEKYWLRVVARIRLVAPDAAELAPDASTTAHPDAGGHAQPEAGE